MAITTYYGDEFFYGFHWFTIISVFRCNASILLPKRANAIQTPFEVFLSLYPYLYQPPKSFASILFYSVIIIIKIITHYHHQKSCGIPLVFSGYFWVAKSICEFRFLGSPNGFLKSRFFCMSGLESSLAISYDIIRYGFHLFKNALLLIFQ